MTSPDPAHATFSREAARALSADYFHDTEVEVDEFERREQEYDLLKLAVQRARTVEDLPEDARAIYFKALHWMADEAETWGGRLNATEFSHRLSPEAQELMGPASAEDSELLAAAIVEAHRQGDKEAAARLGELAKTPWMIQQVLGGGGSVGQESPPTD